MPLPPVEALRPQDVLMEQITLAHRAAYDLIALLDSISNWDTKQVFQVATTESLTAGLMFATLVDIPIGGAYKYGAFAVYDTDAKHLFNGVTAHDVYTHKCARDMAVGVLKNTNASVAIAVTGNAMPYQSSDDNLRQLGEVFIGVAAYVQEGGEMKIKVRTTVFNACLESRFPRVCSLWFDNVYQERQLKSTLGQLSPPLNADTMKKITRLIDGINDPELTSLMSNYIRNYTVEKAIRECIAFLTENKASLVVPPFVQEAARKKYFDTIESLGDTNVTNNKYLERPSLQILCENDTCIDETRGDSVPNLHKKFRGGRTRKQRRRTH